MLQCVAVCVAAYRSMLKFKTPGSEEGRTTRLQCVAVCCSELHVVQCVAVCCSVVQCGAVCCSVLQCAVVCCSAT